MDCGMRLGAGAYCALDLQFTGRRRGPVETSGKRDALGGRCRHCSPRAAPRPHQTASSPLLAPRRGQSRSSVVLDKISSAAPDPHGQEMRTHKPIKDENFSLPCILRAQFFQTSIKLLLEHEYLLTCLN